MQNRWLENFKVHSFQIDANRRLTLESLCGMFQESAWNHAENLNFGYSTLKETNKLWVLSRLAVEINRLPLWQESLKLYTWPRKFESIYAFRDFEVYDQNDRRIICGSSVWLVIDQFTRRPQRVQKYLCNVPLISTSCLGSEDPPKLTGGSCVGGEAVGFKTVYGDIDMNGHINNTRYVAWALNSYSSAFHHSYQLKTVVVNYLSEMLENENITVYTVKQEELLYSHNIIRLRDNAEICRISATWQ